MNPFVNLQLSYTHRESNKGGFKNKHSLKNMYLYYSFVFAYIKLL